jgi:hypothetical protein
MSEINQRHLESTELLKQFSDTARAVYGNHAYTAGFYESMLAYLASTYLEASQYAVLMDSIKEINQRHTMQLMSKK